MMKERFSYNIYKESADYIRDKLPNIPEYAVTLGSGLSVIEDELTDKVSVYYSDIPNFPVSGLFYQQNRLVYGLLNGIPILLLNGRFHYYEGFSMQECGFYVPVLKILGIKYLILTNACGGISKELSPGDIVVVYDHFKFYDDSPIRGDNIEELGVRFPDMQSVYDKSLIDKAFRLSSDLGIELHKGIYAYMPGPQYETPAEIRALSIIGADVVGMSTIPEVITAAHCSLPILCFSTVSNYAAGITGEPLTGEEVIEMGKKTSVKLIKLIKAIISD